MSTVWGTSSANISKGASYTGDIATFKSTLARPFNLRSDIRARRLVLQALGLSGVKATDVSMSTKIAVMATSAVVIHLDRFRVFDESFAVYMTVACFCVLVLWRKIVDGSKTLLVAKFDESPSLLKCLMQCENKETFDLDLRVRGGLRGVRKSSAGVCRCTLGGGQRSGEETPSKMPTGKNRCRCQNAK